MGIYEGISAANDLIAGFTSVASSKREMWIKQAANGILLFFVFAVFGCMDFATLTFHFEYVLTASYWGTVGTKTIAAVCAFNIGINLIMDSEILNNAILQELIVKYNELQKKKQIDFEVFVRKTFNREEKKKAYVSWINKKLYRLNKFSRRSDRLLYDSALPESQERKRRNRYCIKRKELEMLKEDSFIENNIDSVFVRYQEVDPAIFELEIDGSPSLRGVKTRGSLGFGRAKESSSVIMGIVVFSMFTTAFVLEADKTEFLSNMEAFWHYFMKVVEDAAIVIWQALQGMLRTRKIVSQQMTQPYSGRVIVLTAYLEWRLNNALPDSKSYLAMKKEEEVIEVTQEEFEKMKSGN